MFKELEYFLFLRDKVHTKEILDHFGVPETQRTRRTYLSLAEAMRRLGWISKMVRIGDRAAMGYVSPEYDTPKGGYVDFLT